MRPEKLVRIEICFSEREIGDPQTGLWVGNISKEISTKKDKPQEKGEPQTVNTISSYPLEAPALDEEVTGMPDPDTSRITSEKGNVLANGSPRSISMNSSNDDREHPNDVVTRALDEDSGPQQEIKTSNIDTERLRLESTKVDIMAEDSNTNELSITLTEETHWKENSKFEALEEIRCRTQ